MNQGRVHLASAGFCAHFRVVLQWVGVQIMQIGLPWARSAMAHYEPEDDPTPKVDEELDEVAGRCPKCHSTEVVFVGRTSELADAKDESSQKFEWSCDSCGHHWVDDGVEKEE
jgi:hypothetical protein